MSIRTAGARRVFLALLSLGCVCGVTPPTARAVSPLRTGPMCGPFNPGAYGCSSSSSAYVEARNFDPLVYLYGATGTPRNQLLLFFHGHNGSPGGNTGFLEYAAELGYDVV